MLFVLDVGNTNTVLGVFARAAKIHPEGDANADGAPRYDRLVANWRVATRQSSTVDEYGVLFRNLFSMASLEASGIHGIVISSVVPPLDPVLRQVCERYFNSKPLFIEPGIKTGMQVLYDNPAEVGETLMLYVTGLGAVSPAVKDGFAAVAKPLSYVVADVAVSVDGLNAPVSFKGLAPGFAGLYQLNFEVPKGVSSGKLVNLSLATPDAVTNEAKLYIK